MDKVKAIKVLKPLVESYVDYANITMKEEDDDIVDALEMAIEALKALDVPDTNVGDMISRQMAIDLFPDDDLEYDTKGGYVAPHLARRMICELPFVQPDHIADIDRKVSISCGQENDLISRQAALDALWKALYEYEDETEKQFKESEDLDVGDWIGHRIFVQNMSDIDRQTILNLPSAQPERTCVNCGRTANNGGWYADGRTRCPIEEHYALPKDGFCHLYEPYKAESEDKE